MAFDSQENGGRVFDTIIIGTGFAGLGMAIRMQQEGMQNFVILERGADVGGTWRDNHYPGCACDVPSHLYSFSFEQNPDWTRMFAPQPEIRDYLRGCADKYGLRRSIRFNSNVTRAAWDESSQRWVVTTAAGDIYTGRTLVSGMGGLSNPSMPVIKGAESFQGARFHSADWDHSLDLRGKRVAVIGTGASAIQFVPQVQKLAARVDLYQRTPAWVTPKPDRVVRGFEKSLFRLVPGAQKAFRAFIYATMEARVLAFTVEPRLMQLFQKLAVKHMHRSIKDPALRRQLTPDYTIGCKRILISDDYYPALAQPNVKVISNGVKEIRARSVVTGDGTEREVDVIIYGTGFKAADPLPRGAIFGKGGVDIIDTWSAGAEAYKGSTVAGFPNLFLIVGPNTGLGHNSMVYMIESQITYILGALKKLKRGGTFEVNRDVQKRYNRKLLDKSAKAIWSVGGCTSWYLDAKGRNVTLWPGATWAFRLQTRRFDDENYVWQPALATTASAH